LADIQDDNVKSGRGNGGLQTVSNAIFVNKMVIDLIYI